MASQKGGYEHDEEVAKALQEGQESEVSTSSDEQLEPWDVNNDDDFLITVGALIEDKDVEQITEMMEELEIEYMTSYEKYKYVKQALHSTTKVKKGDKSKYFVLTLVLNGVEFKVEVYPHYTFKDLREAFYKQHGNKLNEMNLTKTKVRTLNIHDYVYNNQSLNSHARRPLYS